MTAGITTIINALKMADQSLLYCPNNVLVERINVYFLLSDIIINGSKKSFHIQRKFVMQTVIVTFFKRGNMILKKVLS